MDLRNRHNVDGFVLAGELTVRHRPQLQDDTLTAAAGCWGRPPRNLTSASRLAADLRELGGHWSG